MNIRKEKGITLIALILTMVILLILSGISITGTMNSKDKTSESAEISELDIIQHAALERYTKAQLTKEELPGTVVEKSKVKELIDEINSLSGANIILKGTTSEYKELNKTDLKNLGISNEDDIYIINYSTGEVINKTKKVTNEKRALYTYSKSDT